MLELQVVEKVAREAGSIILNYYQSDYDVQDKSYHNPVTTADHASNDYLKDFFSKEFPEDGWFSEETADSPERLSKERVWVVDPLDGTKEFIEGVPQFVVSIALVINHQPRIGVLYNPVTKEMFSAKQGEGAWLDGDPIQCANKAVPSEMVILNSRTETRHGLWEPFTHQFKELRAIGSVAYKLGLTAAGKADIFASLRPKNEWDICAGHCIIEAAGGILLNLKGKNVTYNNRQTEISPGLVAGSPVAVEATLNILMS